MAAKRKKATARRAVKSKSAAKAVKKIPAKKSVARKVARKAATRKTTAKITERRKASPRRKSAFQKMLTAEGWKRLMMGAQN